MGGRNLRIFGITKVVMRVAMLHVFYRIFKKVLGKAIEMVPLILVGEVLKIIEVCFDRFLSLD